MGSLVCALARHTPKSVHSCQDVSDKQIDMIQISLSG